MALYSCSKEEAVRLAIVNMEDNIKRHLTGELEPFPISLKVFEQYQRNIPMAEFLVKRYDM